MAVSDLAHPPTLHPTSISSSARVSSRDTVTDYSFYKMSPSDVECTSRRSWFGPFRSAVHDSRTYIPHAFSAPRRPGHSRQSSSRLRKPNPQLLYFTHDVFVASPGRPTKWNPDCTTYSFQVCKSSEELCRAWASPFYQSHCLTFLYTRFSVLGA